MITVGCDRATSIAALAVAAKHERVYATVGLHPHEAIHGVDSIADLLQLGGDGPRPVAVGECGLDYYYDHSPRDVQREAVAAQIDIANALGLPLVIHTRDAWDDTFDILDAHGVPERVVFHCFTGGEDEAAKCLARGAYLSMSGIVTFKSATDVRAAAATCPADRLLVETDSPYLAPVPHRGKVNRPAWVPHVGECIAEIRGISPDEIRLSTAASARLVFGVTAS
jgi:TatD DNase family protein